MAKGRARDGLCIVKDSQGNESETGYRRSGQGGFETLPYDTVGPAVYMVMTNGTGPGLASGYSGGHVGDERTVVGQGGTVETGKERDRRIGHWGAG